MGDKSTPTPWNYIRGDSLLSVKANGEEIASVGNAPYWERFTSTHEANAALIVRAVNRDHLFGELVEAVEEIAKGAGAFDMDHHQHAMNVIEEAKATARAILAKVKDEGHA